MTLVDIIGVIPFDADESVMMLVILWMTCLVLDAIVLIIIMLFAIVVVFMMLFAMVLVDMMLRWSTWFRLISCWWKLFCYCTLRDPRFISLLLE